MSQAPAKQVARETGSSYGGVLYVDSLTDTIIGNISKITTQENLYDLWHDRAVFHFLTGVSIL